MKQMAEIEGPTHRWCFFCLRQTGHSPDHSGDLDWETRSAFVKSHLLIKQKGHSWQCSFLAHMCSFWLEHLPRRLHCRANSAVRAAPYGPAIRGL